MTQLRWLLSDSVEDLKLVSQVQNHTRGQCSDQRRNQQTSCSDRQAGMVDNISLANAVPTSSEGNNDSPKNKTNHFETAEFLCLYSLLTYQLRV